MVYLALLVSLMETFQQMLEAVITDELDILGQKEEELLLILVGNKPYPCYLHHLADTLISKHPFIILADN